MATPNPPARTYSVSLLCDVLVLIVGLLAGIYFLVDDTPAAWAVRLAYGMAITAGVACILYALARLSGRP